MKKAICFILVFTLIFPVGFSFVETKNKIEDIYSTFDTSISTVSGILGLGKINAELPQESDVGKTYWEVGATGELKNVAEYVEWKIKKDCNIANEESLKVLYVSDYVYDVVIRQKGDVTKKSFCSLRVTITNGEIQQDCLYVGPLSFNNETGEEFENLESQPIIDGPVYSTCLFLYKSDSQLIPVFNMVGFGNISAFSNGWRVPKSITRRKTTFQYYWDEWTGG